MKLHEIKAPEGRKRSKKIVGRGIGSGHGGTSTRGHKGQMSRAGSSRKPGFEGGQMPLIRRMPKRGFNNKIFANLYQPVNLKSLEIFSENTVISPKELRLHNIIKNTKTRVKILGMGDIKKALTVKAHAFSKSAVEKIQSVGGKIERI